MIWLVMPIVLSMPICLSPSFTWGAEALPTPAAQALEAMLDCERPQGGWIYRCDPRQRVAGFTGIMRRAEAVAAPLGLADWDLVVLRGPGTPAAGRLLIQAYRESENASYLRAARRTRELLVNCQLPSGGWFSEMPVHENQLAGWLRFLLPGTSFGTTLDDDVTPGAVRFLLALWEVTQQPRYRESVERAITLLLRAQLPSGAWPLTWRPTWRRWISPSFEDGPSLNDAATSSVIQALLDAARILKRPELLTAAQRGGDWFVHSQNPAPFAGWARQYDAAGLPTTGRSFEPVALATWESRHVLDALHALAEATQDKRFCQPLNMAIDWLRQSAFAPGCWARFCDFEDGQPIYIGTNGKRVLNVRLARRPYRWTGDYGILALFASLGLDGQGRKKGRISTPEPASAAYSRRCRCMS